MVKQRRFNRYLIVFILASAGAIELFCNNPTSNNKYGCDGPTISACAGDPCVYAHIYDADGNFVAETNGNTGRGQVYWNGTDCRGNKVPCGKYTVRYHLLISGMEQQTTEELLMTDSSSVSKVGRKACDSLKTECTGSYAEMYETSVIGSDGKLYSNEVGCVCCK